MPLGDPVDVDVAGLRVVAFTDNGIRTPTPETVARSRPPRHAPWRRPARRVEWSVPPGLDDAWETWDRLIRSDGYAWLRRLITAAGTPGARVLRDAAAGSIPTRPSPATR